MLLAWRASETGTLNALALGAGRLQPMPPSIPSEHRPSPRAISLYYFGIFAVLGVYLPLFPSWLEARGIQGLAMGAIAATLPAMGLIAPPVFGLIADPLGVRGVADPAACAGAFVVFALLALSSALGASLGFAGPSSRRSRSLFDRRCS